MAEEKKTPAAPKAVQFDHGSKSVYVLIPCDLKERSFCLEALEEPFARLETPPTVRTEIRLAKLPSEAVLYVCHPVSARVKSSDGYFSNQDTLHVSNPIDIGKFNAAADEDGISLLDIFGLTDAIVKACLTTRAGRVYRAQLSAEKDMSQKVVKLFNS
jgi:hypothetical protein